MVKEMEVQMRANGYAWDASFYRLRCLGHIIHLVAEDFFFKKAPQPEDHAGWRGYEPAAT